MSTIELTGVSAADEYHELLMADARGEEVLALQAHTVLLREGVSAKDFHRDRAIASKRVDDGRAIAVAADAEPRSRELHSQERSLLDAETAAIAAAEERERAEYERRLAEAVEAAKEPLRKFKEANAAEQAKLAKIADAARIGRASLVASADPMIDVAINKLENAEPDKWGPFAVSRGPGAPLDMRALARLEEREKQIEALREMKLDPRYFEHAASSPWRTYEPEEAAS